MDSTWIIGKKKRINTFTSRNIQSLQKKFNLSASINIKIVIVDKE